MSIPGSAKKLRLDHIFTVGEDERCVGLYQDPVQRNMRYCVPQSLCSFLQLKNRSPNTDMVTQFQILLCNFLGAIKTVDHAAQFSGRVHSQYPECILMGVTDMEDHGQFQLPCQIQLVNKPQMLL